MGVCTSRREIVKIVVSSKDDVATTSTTPATTPAPAAAAAPTTAATEEKKWHSSTSMVMVFAFLRNSHEGLRGLLASACEAAAAGDIDAACVHVNEFRTFVRHHMAMEDNGFFPELNRRFDNTAVNEGFDKEHKDDVVEQQELMGACDAAKQSGDAVALAAAIEHFRAAHLRHLEHEERVMMPLTRKIEPKSDRARIIHTFITDLWEGTIGAIVPYTVREMTKRNPYPSFRMFVAALQKACTPRQYAQLLPVVEENTTAEIWLKFQLEGLCDPGKYQDE